MPVNTGYINSTRDTYLAIAGYDSDTPVPRNKVKAIEPGMNLQPQRKVIIIESLRARLNSVQEKANAKVYVKSGNMLIIHSGIFMTSST